MENLSSFSEVVEAVDRLSLEEQETLVHILTHRMIERRRAVLAKDIQEARHEYLKGDCHPVSPNELMKEIAS